MLSPSTFLAPCKLLFTVQPNLVWASCKLHLNVKLMYHFYQDTNKGFFLGKFLHCANKKKLEKFVKHWKPQN
jgi:hypothetical protein